MSSKDTEASPLLDQRPPSTPLPKGIIAVLFFAMLFTTMVMTSAFSYLPRLVHEFGISNTDTGYYVGVLASSLYIGRIIFSSFWGYLTDHVGRKFTLIVICNGLSVTTLAFGFATTFKWALVSRVIQGPMLCAWIVAKSIVANVCDYTNQATAMTILVTSVTTGKILGQAVGGLTSFPTEQYPNLFEKDSVLATYKILIPNLFVASGLAFTGIAAWIILPADEKKNLVEERKDLKENNTSLAEKWNNSVLKKVVSDKWVLVFCVVEFLFHTHMPAMDEMVPLFLSTKEDHKGLGYAPKQIGLVLLLATIPLVPLELSAVRIFTMKLGIKSTLISMNLVLAVLMPLLPLVYLFNKRYWYLNAVLFNLFYGLVKDCGTLALTLMSMNMVFRKYVGTLTGVTITMVSIGRVVGPAIIGPIYSWSLQNIDIASNTKPLGFPFNQYFAFFILSIIALICAAIVCTIPSSYNHSKQEESTND